MSENARSGWDSSFGDFQSAQPKRIRERLIAFIRDASPEQIRAWDAAIPPLQSEVSEVLIRDDLAEHYSAILEYELPMESRRPDVILLVGAGVMVIELKGKLYPSQADLDQAAAWRETFATTIASATAARSLPCSFQLEHADTSSWWTAFTSRVRTHSMSSYTVSRAFAENRWSIVAPFYLRTLIVRCRRWSRQRASCCEAAISGRFSARMPRQDRHSTKSRESCIKRT
jgi:hypothetical protein